MQTGEAMCKGSIALGSGCGQCSRCREELAAGVYPPRGSGAAVRLVAYKTGNFALQQVSKMRLRPDVYVPVLFETAQGYGMPVLRPLCTPYEVRRAMELLRTLWLDPMPYLQEWGIIQRQRRAYYSYVRNLPADGLLMDRLDRLWNEAQKQTHAIYCNHVHGDATLENCMWSECEKRPYWIDPCVRRDPCSAPLEAEVDLGKLLQSTHGYPETVPDPMREQLSTFLLGDMRGANDILMRFYFVSHLVRLWRHQPDKHKWAVEILKSGWTQI